MKNKIALLSIFALTASMFGGVAYADDPEETETSTSSSSAPEEDSQSDEGSSKDESSKDDDSEDSKDKDSSKDDEESTDDEKSGAGQCVIGLDPGHNKDDVDEHDPKTGAYMSDYANGQELDDMWKMGEDMKDKLEEEGYEAVLLRGSKDENSTYRDKVDKAESSNVDMGVSLHTTPGANLSMIMTQTVGGFREGKGEDGSHKKVEFTAKETADKSQEYAEKIASVRSDIEPNPVSVKKEWSFDGREPLWSGNIPIISLIAENTPWVYSEFGSDTGGGAKGVTDEELAVYTEGLIEGIKEALPADSCEGSSSKGSDDSDDDSDNSSKDDEDSSKDNDKESSKSDDSSKDDDKGDKGSDKKESKPKKSTQSNDGITQWLGYYPKISIVGDVLADSITSESLVELLKKNGAQEVTKGSTGDSDIMEIASDISGMNSSAIIIAVSANSYAPLVGDDVLKAEAEISNAVLEASKSPDVEKVVWISPILRSEQEGTEINEDVKAVNDLVRGVEKNIKANNSPKLSFIHGGRVVGSNQEESLPNEAGSRLLIMQSAGVLAAHAKKSGYEPEVSTSSSKSKDEDSSKDDDNDSKDDKKSSKDDDKDKDSSKDDKDSKDKDSSKDDDSSKNDEESTDDKDSAKDDEESTDEDSKDDDSSSKKASPPGTVTEEDWELLAQCESNGDWSINTGNGYHGGVQFAAGTWTGNGGDKYAPTADKATKEEQMEIANKVLKGQGWGAWPACTAGAASAVTSKEPAPEGTFAD